MPMLEQGRDLSVQRNLSGRRVAVLVADGFEMVEYSVPVNALRLAGADITVISLRRGRIRGVNLHEPARRVHADLTIDEADPNDYDALFFPGGFINPDLLRQSNAVRNFVRAFDRAQKPIATLCHGPWVLASAGLVRGRTLTSWPGVRDDLVNAGGTWLDQEVVRDGNWVTSRGPQDLRAFVSEITDAFSESAQRQPQRITERRESSPQHDHPPATLIRTMRWMPKPTLRGIAMGSMIGGGLAMAALRRRKAA